ncbi:hypothetical protein PpBr36_02329 [Pyricularia pennisetigena]|uniref:hypothetical protein n=1 Tax=Pyricularia pennisetigena TaxID=1578925 RepID=UPI001154D1A6|nr:hypothetical protein PpBr36_02329 [Pyricularia pennisetigena]TLS30416.1 hypothetical protein PpBr36_02329 [Pyricularia pennisetigena]
MPDIKQFHKHRLMERRSESEQGHPNSPKIESLLYGPSQSPKPECYLVQYMTVPLPAGPGGKECNYK